MGRVPEEGDSTKYFDRFFGTLTFASPEILHGNVYRGPEAEVWALGVLLYTILFGQSPFLNADEIIKMKIRYPTNSLKTEYVDLLKRIFNPDPKNRITLDQVKHHPWVQGALIPM